MKRIILLAFLCAASPSIAALPGADLLAKLITTQFDTNSDSSVDQGEWQNGIAKGFAELDRNHDGLITGQELDALAGPLAEETGDLAAGLVASLIKQAVLTMDTDKDGSVSAKEFEAVGNGLFAKLDSNKNGTLDNAELLELPSRLLAK